jgi:hypothetical protein
MRSLRTALRTAIAAGALGFVCAAAPAGAAVLFTDDFESGPVASVLNFNAFTNWNVVDGTVDYIRQGNPWVISCIASGCVDLDGSTNDAGRMVSKSEFTLDPGTTYRFSMSVSGNQRGGTFDRVAWGLTNAGGDAGAAMDIHYLHSFETVTAELGGLSGSYRLFVENTNPSSNDNVGPILDNVVFESLTPTSVPEPGVLALVGFALAALAITVRARAEIKI